MFSKACEYALRAVLYISIRSINGSRLSIGEIAREIDAPVAFTAKILQTLARNKLISSVKGPNGGFFVNPKSRPVTLNAVVNVIDGVDVLHDCALGLRECSDRFPCPIHHEIKQYKERLRKVLKGTTVQDLAAELMVGNTHLRSSSGRRTSTKRIAD
jgi:Rrf2 family protein